ncbi:MAG: class III signal peptide-containing protein [archaeon]|nr:class III signal peptide-containing protein [archaeon]
MKTKNNSNGQAALEYLLLLGGVVMIAAVVISLLAGLGETGKNTTETGANKINELFQDILGGGSGGGQQDFAPLTPMVFQDEEIGQGVTVSSPASQQILLEWDASCFEDETARNPCSDISYYKIYYKTGSAANALSDYTTVLSPIDATTSCSSGSCNYLINAGLTSGETYYLYIMAVDAISQEGTTFTSTTQQNVLVA